MTKRQITFRADCRKYPVKSEIVKEASMDITLKEIGEHQELHLKVKVSIEDENRAQVIIHMGNERIKGWWVRIDKERHEVTVEDIL